MNNKGIFYTNVSDYETKEDMMNDFIALRMYDIAKDKEIEELTISLQEQEALTISWYNKTKQQAKEIERLTELCNKYEEEHKTTFETWQKDIKENEQLRTALNSKESIIKEVREYIKYQLEHLDFEKDTKAKILGAMVLVMLDEEKK